MLTKLLALAGVLVILLSLGATLFFYRFVLGASFLHLFVFPTLYICVGVSCATTFGATPLAPAKRAALLAFCSQGLLNVCWTPLFFGAKRLGAACALAAVLAVAAAATLVAFARVAGRAAALPLLPYVGWLTFAFALNWRIWRLNPFGELPSRRARIQSP